MYQLTNFGDNQSKVPTGMINDRWRVLYFLRGQHGRASDDQIKQFARINVDNFPSTMRKLIQTRMVVAL